jgi:hypothetical protein
MYVSRVGGVVEEDSAVDEFNALDATSQPGHKTRSRRGLIPV